VLRRILTTALLACATAFAQSPVAPPTPASPKPLGFDVVSIRPAKSKGGVFWATTPDGYRVTGQSLFFTIMMTYFPQGTFYWSDERLAGAPPWINGLYDIDARVSEADLTEWQKQGTTLDKKPMLRQMLQTMLADRCHLVAHMVPGAPVAGFSLELGKHAPHLTESKPDEVLPPGIRLLDGGIETTYGPGQKPRFTFYGASMADFARFLPMRIGGRPVLDHTGLTGRYDFVVNWVDDPESDRPAGAASSDDPDPLSHWDIESLGFRLTPIKIPANTLVIDHIEKPSEN